MDFHNGFAADRLRGDYNLRCRRFSPPLWHFVFALAGLGCIGTSLKIFWTQRKLDKMNRSDTNGYRKNVRIHTEEYYDL